MKGSAGQPSLAVLAALTFAAFGACMLTGLASVISRHVAHHIVLQLSASIALCAALVASFKAGAQPSDLLASE